MGYRKWSWKNDPVPVACHYPLAVLCIAHQHSFWTVLLFSFLYSQDGQENFRKEITVRIPIPLLSYFPQADRFPAIIQWLYNFCKKSNFLFLIFYNLRYAQRMEFDSLEESPAKV